MKDLSAREQLGVPEGFVEFSPSACEQSIARRFEEQTASFPYLAAIRLPDRDISYRELNDAANRAARWLSENINDTPTPIALLFDQGYENILWTLGILKTGHCYAPLDPRLPIEILQALLVDLAPSGVIVAPRYRQIAQDCVAGYAPVVDAGSTLADAAKTSSSNLGKTIGADDTAYVFYTSGSTGRPKGVVDCQRNVLHNVMRYTNSLKFAPGDVFSLVQGPHFSGTVSTMFGALLNGATLAPFNLVDEGLANLSEWLRRSHVTVFHGVPSIFRALSDPTNKFSDIRLVRLEGDRATPLDVQYFNANFSDGCVLVNGLGATECGLVRQFFIGKETSCAQLDALPIGYAVPDMTVRVVDGEGISVVRGVKGEIVVESKYLATRYWKNPDLTAQRFEELANGVRRYRTGDLGSMNEDGCLAHLGRTDHLVRINGEFLAAADIEKALLAVPGVAQAAVRDYFDYHGEQRLCAYIVTDIGSSLTVTALRAHLAEGVPRFQMPSAFLFLDALPLSKDFKVDYQGLPYRGSLTAYLQAKCAEISGHPVAEIATDASFISLGFDSLIAMVLANHLRRDFGCSVGVPAILQSKSLRHLAQEIAQKNGESLFRM